MNEQQHALKIFEEELGKLAIEVLQLQHTVSKAMRFGVDDHRGMGVSNIQRIQAEWQDLLGAIAHLSRHGINLEPDLEAIHKKLEKIEKYTEYSILCQQVFINN